ncbi:MAG: beta-Ala-His dipeptidase [Planctomycetota bacterium]|jgi:dipeptidase D|nr:beta-Ala-His dipeptidase [Planctomycetota bacterium]
MSFAHAACLLARFGGGCCFAAGSDVGAANKKLVADLKPAGFFRFFAEIADVPRRSGRCGAMAEYLERFAGERGLDCRRDPAGNVVIGKRAQGTASRTTVILQAHQDMVCAAEPGKAHDFAADPIAFRLDGDWLGADGTTLGADDGAGMAAILAVLDDASLVHPALEALFTVDEETTMAGALAVRAGDLRGGVLVNLDSEEYGVAYVSSAAGVVYDFVVPVAREAASAPPSAVRRLVVGGLKGGHSGAGINQGLANAFVLLARVVEDAAARFGAGVCDFGNGPARGADNAIPPRAEAVLALASEADAAALERLASEWRAVFRREYRASDPDAEVAVEAADKPAAPPITAESRDRLLAAIRLMPLGVVRHVQDADMAEKPYGEIPVETSNNLGVIELREEEALLRPMARGSVHTRLEEVDGGLRILAALVGGELRALNRFPGWEMAHPPGRIQRFFIEEGWKLAGVHAGLECGVLVDAMRAEGRELDAISVGPDVRDGHTPRERLGVASVGKFWNDLVRVLAKL